MGWIFNKEMLTSFGPGLVPMAPITAFLFVLLSLIFIINLSGTGYRSIRRLTAGITLIVIFIALLILIFSSFNIYPEFDHLIFRSASSYSGFGAGHMSPITALLFSSIGISYFIVKIFKRKTFSIITPIALAGFAVLVSLTFFIGYLIGKPFLYGMNFVPPAANTCLGLLCLSIAITVESFFYEKLDLEAFTAMDLRFKNVFEHSAEGRSMIYPDGTFQVNKAFAEMLGYTIEELNSLTWIRVTHPDDLELNREIMNQMIQNKTESVRFEKRYIHKNGQVVWVDLQSYLHRDKQGNPEYFINSASDITSYKALEDQLIKAKEMAEKSNQLKDAFIANMSHEIRTPLNAILGFSDLLHDEILLSGNTEFESYFEIIHTSSQRLMRTVDMILNVSRLQVGAYEPHPVKIDITKMISSLVAEYRLPASKKGLVLEFRNQLGDIAILADEYCILHSISNLIDNAIKYTRSGKITLRLYYSEDQHLCLDVKDTGIGISDEFLMHIFNPFTQEENSSTRNFEGIGLGLSLSYKMLTSIGSRLNVKSQKGKGTTFTITFVQST